MTNNSDIIMVTFEEMLKVLKQDSPIPAIDQIKNIITQIKAELVAIGNVIISSEELIDRLEKVDLSLFMNKDNKATTLWFKLSIPKSYSSSI